MSNRNLALVETPIDAGQTRSADFYPLHLVLWGVLAFCLSVWGVVILAVRHLV